MLKETFIGLLTNYTDNERLTNELWMEIDKNYSSKKRHYHTLQHLENLLAQLTEIKTKIQNREAILFTLLYPRHNLQFTKIRQRREKC